MLARDEILIELINMKDIFSKRIHLIQCIPNICSRIEVGDTIKYLWFHAIPKPNLDLSLQFNGSSSTSTNGSFCWSECAGLKFQFNKCF